MRQDIANILIMLCKWKEVHIVEAEICPDHVHMLVEITPKMSVSEFVGYLKGKSTLMIFERHANLKYKYGNRHFWCRGYYVDTVGKKCKKDWRVYSKSVEGRFGIWSDVYERVYWPVYGWAGNQKQEKVISPRGLASSWCCGWRTFRWVFRLQHREWALIGRKTNHRLSRWWWLQWVIS